MKLRITVLGSLIFILGSCAYGPDSSTEVTTATASYSGMAPQYHPTNGMIMGYVPTGASVNKRSTMLNP